MRLKNISLIILSSIFLLGVSQEPEKKDGKEDTTSREQMVEQIDSISASNYDKAAKLDSIFNYNNK